MFEDGEGEALGRITGNVIGDLTRVLRWGTATGDGDDRLLERFLAGRDESAFTALVARHGPMVLGVCRRVLRDEHDVEDAFQATFLVLVRSAGAIRRGELVGPWLHGVAHRVAVRARAGAARRFVRERNGADVEAMAVAPDSRNADHAELRAILDAELARLPEALRAPLVLCYLEGLTHEQAAGRLRQPVGTIRSRLSRGRDRLRTRLARRGVSADDAAWGSMVLTEPISTRLLEATVRAVLDSTIPSTAATALVSATAASLAKGVLDAMLITKLKLAGACALGLILTISGVSGYAFHQNPGLETKKGKESPPAVEESPGPSPAGAVEPTRSTDPAILEMEHRKRELEKEITLIDRQIQHIKERLVHKKDDIQADRPDGAVGDDPLRGVAQSKAAAPASPPRTATARAKAALSLPYTQGNKIVIVASPDGHVVTGYSAETGVAKSIRLAEEGEPDLEVKAMVNNVMGALFIRGPKIHRVAAFNSIDGRWYTQDLAEPTTAASPNVGQTGLAYYAFGSHVYAFSCLAGRWDVLKVPDGGEPRVQMGLETISCQIGDHLHVFGIKTGKWTDIDLRGVPDEPKIEQSRAERPAEPVADQPHQAAPALQLDVDQKTDGTTQPEYLDPSRPIFVSSQDGHVVTIFGIRNPAMGGMGGMMSGGMGSDGKSRGMMRGMGGGMGAMMMGGPEKPYSDPQLVRLAAEGDPQLEVAPVFNPESITLLLRGERIQRLAIFNMNQQRWDVQELRESVKEAKPVTCPLMTTYALGRRLYTYSMQAGKWSVLELPDGVVPEARASNQGLTLRYGDKIHMYNVNTGDWTDFDVRGKPRESGKPQ